MIDMYAAYVKERLGKDVYITDEGFAVYQVFHNDQGGHIYIEEIYVKPEFRRKGAGTRIGDAICEIAKGKGIKRVYGSVNTLANGATASMKSLLYYNMEFSHIKNEMIFFVKKLGD